MLPAADSACAIFAADAVTGSGRESYKFLERHSRRGCGDAQGGNGTAVRTENGS